MTLDTEAFRVVPGEKLKLKHRPTAVEALYRDEDDYKRQLAAQVERLSELQNLLYAHNRYSLLLVFQAMDAAGKDSIIKHVMSGVNPQGCQVFSFKHPSPQELDHDFLWRTTQCLPERGRIGIFNRSYYEEVLIVRVHPEILAAQSLPLETTRAKDFWAQRYDSINGLERHLHRNGTRVLKFFLHLSRDEQRRRFLARLDDPSKNWKFAAADLDEREQWPAYMKAYTAALEATSSEHAPWYAVPADDKRNARLIVSQVIVDALAALKMSYPPPALDAKALVAARKRLKA
ncbi:phosphate--nucleotide phosphotransferase [Pelomonas sp. Root1217]|uniref:ADP-polyphosphate phosphotransferase n=1 Tax=Pelomonas sp. Root1217 TaxID=1736430 RepID=UPI00070B2C06|nr:ADP-polyphosphate phosphotransferase [Pelomonas sp. Root1217]KQV60276.1 phosphate--nucleotide phosphotransferase [Pelomonas sp. Root1217]